MLFTFFCLTLLLEIANSAGYLKTSNLSLTNWNAAVQKQATGIANSLIQCASLCQHTEDFVPSGTCNAFKYEGSDSKCTLANIGFLEDVQPNIESQSFHVNFEAVANLVQNCYGGDGCCRQENQCKLNEGDCSSEEDCVGQGLVCGTNNCLTLGLANRAGGLWDPSDDCCERRCTTEHPCPQGDGDCDTDGDCQRPTWQKCQADICINSNYFPVAQFPNNTADKYSPSDDCCRKRCYPFEKCGHTIDGCENNDDCQTGLECLPSGKCFDIDECSGAVGTGASYCGVKASCVNSIGAFSCTCHLGYETHVPNVGCTDIDECLASAPNLPAGCALRTNCFNSEGKYNNYISRPVSDQLYSPTGSYDCECRQGYEGDPHVQCIDIDECELGGMYACTFGEKTGLADMACVNWPGTFQCVDAAVINGGYSAQWHMIIAKNKDHYKESIVKCAGHGLPNLSPRRYYHNTVYVNDYLFTCGGYDFSVGKDNALCTKLNLATKSYEPMASMLRNKRHFTLNYVEDKIYSVGGYNIYGNWGETGTRCARTTEEYDIEFNTWTYTTDILHARGIHWHCTVNVGYKIYVLGGHVCTIGTVDTVYIFDTRTKIWTLDGPRLRYGITYDLGCSTLYLADGRHVIIAAGGHPTRKSSVQFYDINAPTTWQGLPNLPINVGEYPHIAYMGKSLFLWSGYSNQHAWNYNNMHVMDWTTHTWDRFTMNRLWNGDEAWNAATVISSKYFSLAQCYSANWPDCIHWNTDYNGYDIDNLVINTKEECANACQSHATCKVWMHEEGPDTCWRKYADVGSYSKPAQAGRAAGAVNRCYYKWMLDETIPQP